MSHVVDFKPRTVAGKGAANADLNPAIDAACDQIVAGYRALEAAAGPVVALLILMSFAGSRAESVGGAGPGGAG